MTLRIGGIVCLLLLGFYTGGQLGKIAPVITVLQLEHNYALSYIGWLTSFIGLFVALSAIPAGLLVDRLGPNRSLYLGSFILFMGSLLFAILEGPIFGLLTRVIEAAGYVLVVIATPTVLNSISPDPYKPSVLALWGGFVPIGFALANFKADLLLGVFGLTGFMLSMSIGLGFFSLLAGIFLFKRRLSPSYSHPKEQKHSLRELPKMTYVIAVSFGLYVGLSISFFTFLPTYLGSLKIPVLLSAGAIALFVPVGNILAGLLLTGKLSLYTGRLAFLGFVISGVCGVLIFSSGTSFLIAGASLLFAFSGGMIASSLFASLPNILPKDMSASLAIGVIAQAGGLATVGGPPIAGFILQSFGWHGLAMLLVTLSITGIFATLLMFNPRPQFGEERE